MNEDFRTLMDLYLSGNATEEEKKRIAEALRAPEYQVQLAAIIDEDFGSEKERAYPEPDSEGIYQKILESIHGSKRPAKLVQWGWKRVAAAAAVLIVLSTGALFLLKPVKKPAETTARKEEQPFKNDVAPGGNKAVLTLANGTAVILDSAGNGALAVQGNAQVMKHGGTLTYNEKGNLGPAQQTVYNTVSTPRGGQYQLVLADGSKVWLNAASSIRFPTAFTGKDRIVEITGEAYFEVTHDASRPFVVAVNDMKVEVLGTHFNINSYADEEAIKTTLLEGAVKVSSTGKVVQLTPGQQSLLDNTGSLSVNKNVNTEEIIAWKEGYFHFESADLKTVLRQFGRWYDVEVIYEGPVSGRKFFGIVKRNNSLTKVLEMLQDNNIVYRIEGKKLIVKSG